MNVREESLSLSKKRQSPAARADKVASLRPEASVNARKQAVRFLRKIRSMLLHSRLNPIFQDQIRLDVGKTVWDNSDMHSLSSQSAARANIRRALELRNKSSFDVSVTLGKNRTYLDDFLRDRKQSISGHFTTQLANLLKVL